MQVYFIGAGPGDPDLITIKGAKLLGEAPLILYAGSLVPRAVLAHCRPDAEKINTANLNLEEQLEIYHRAKQTNLDVVRLHSGDPAIYGALAEQMRRLDSLAIVYQVIPGVSSYSAAAAQLKCELTKPGVSQTIILTRVSGKASPVPQGEALSGLARHRATLCIFLSGPQLTDIVGELKEHYQEDTPIALVCRATWPSEKILRSTLANVLEEAADSDWTLTTMLIVGDVLRQESGLESCLYSANFEHKYRKIKMAVNDAHQ